MVSAAGGITDANYGRLTKIGWSRASRTDKGVTLPYNETPLCSADAQTAP